MYHTDCAPAAAGGLSRQSQWAAILRLVNTLLDFSRIEAGRAQAV
jgi:hypothetical protein